VHARIPGRCLLLLSVAALVAVACAPSEGDAPAGTGRTVDATSVPTASVGGKRSGGTQRVVVAAAGDIACPGAPCAGQRATAAEVRHLHPDAVLVLGDLQYEHGALADFRSSYDPTWGTFKRITDPSPGNHEYETAGATGYFRYFGKRAHPPLGYYGFDLGAWHVDALNANCDAVDCGRERRWLARDLARNEATCQLAFWHQPRWSSGPHGSDATYGGFWTALMRAGVDVVLNGHDHDYERFAKLDPSGHFSGRGIREFVVGTGGLSHYPFGPPVRGSQVRVPDRFGVLRLVLSKRSYGWRFVSVRGAVLDQGSTRCHR
jgi:alkaline phosphatase